MSHKNNQNVYRLDQSNRWHTWLLEEKKILCHPKFHLSSRGMTLMFFFLLVFLFLVFTWLILRPLSSTTIQDISNIFLERYNCVDKGSNLGWSRVFLFYNTVHILNRWSGTCNKVAQKVLGRSRTIDMGLNRDELINSGPKKMSGLGIVIMAHQEFPNLQQCARAHVEAFTKRIKKKATWAPGL